MKSHQHGCLNKACTMRNPGGMQTGKGKSSRSLNPRQRSTVKRGVLREREMVFPREDLTAYSPLQVPFPKMTPARTHIDIYILPKIRILKI